MLYIAVHRGEVRQVIDTQHAPEPNTLVEGKDYTVEYIAERTERCEVCNQAYSPEEIIQREGEQLCVSCDLDKHPEAYPGLY